MSLIVFHVQDNNAQPLVAKLSAVSTIGNWTGVTNKCGDGPVTPEGKIGATLAPGHYDITISSDGYKDRLLPADLSDCGVITVGLEPSDIPFSPTHLTGKVSSI